DKPEEPDYTYVTCSAEPKTADISTTAETTADTSTTEETTADTSTAAETTADTSTAADTTAAKPSSGKVAYLTFDDGPNKTNTTNILDTLDEYGVKATFFTVGYLVDR